MKRRQLMRYAGTGLLTASLTGLASGFQKYQAAQQPGGQKSSDGLSVQWLGHTCFLFTGSGLRILVNPFRTIGCTAGYRAPKVAADVVLISSQLLDEGAAEDLPGDPKILYEPGVYKIQQDVQIQGIAIDHDRIGGRRFGTNIAWRWTQAGINILHLGGAAGPIGIEQKILMAGPDLALIPVGGGPKAYTPSEAMQALQILNPKLVIPTQYRTEAADAAKCDIVPVDEFLTLTSGKQVQRIAGDTLNLKPADLSGKQMAIAVLSYNFSQGVGLKK